MATSSLSAFERLVPDVLREIVLWTLTATDLGPPTDLYNLLLVNKHIHSMLMGSRPHCFIESRELFRLKFDNAAPARRFGALCSTAEYMDELYRRFNTIKFIRHTDVCCGYEELEHHLWVAMVMMLENDGCNAQQLVHWANLPSFLEKLVVRQQELRAARRTTTDSPLLSDTSAVTTVPQSVRIVLMISRTWTIMSWARFRSSDVSMSCTG